LTNWKGLPSNFKVEDYEGFVYLIVNTLTNQKYIGKKFFWSIRKIKVKGRKNRRIVRKESDWQTYKSSCAELISDIDKLGIKNFKFNILSLHTSRRDTNYAEIKEQFERDVLNAKLDNEYEYYNSNILCRFYRGQTIDKEDEE
jgi:hypothetical protein